MSYPCPECGSPHIESCRAVGCLSPGWRRRLAHRENVYDLRRAGAETWTAWMRAARWQSYDPAFAEFMRLVLTGSLRDADPRRD